MDESNAYDNPLSIRWDDNSIGREAATLPAEYAEDYRWFKCFTRDECAKDSDVLTRRMLKLGADIDKTTWSKVIRGRLVVDNRGEPRPNPVINLDRFSQLVSAARDNVRLEQIEGRIGWVQTRVADGMFRYFLLKWAKGCVNKFGIVIGATGSSKSATAREFARQNNHGLCIHVECPETGGMSELISRIAVRYGIGSKRSAAAKKAAIFEQVTARNMIIVDNAQELWVANGGSEQPKFSFLRRLQDETGCTIILLITPTFERTLRDQMMESYFEQFIGRTGGPSTWHRLPAYPPEEDCVAIAKSLGLVDAAKHAKALAKIASRPGRIRILFDVLQEGKSMAAEAKQKFTFDFLPKMEGER